MIGVKRNNYRGDSSGFAWPNAKSGTGVIRDIFGPRPFAPHIVTEGYDYDFHRGIDVVFNQGDPVYAPATGAICRLHFTHYGWQDSTQLTQWTLTDPSSSLSYALNTNFIRFTAARVGSLSFPGSVAKFQANREYVAPLGSGNDWVMEIKLNSALSGTLTGSFGIGIFDTVNTTQYVALDYDNATFTVKAVGTTTFTRDGTTKAAANQTWFRLEYSSSNDTFTWKYGTDGSNWTNVTTESGKTFGSLTASFKPTFYWRSADTNASSYTIDVAQINWYDLGQSIGRFGNWIQLQTPTYKVVMEHFQSLVTTLGSFVSVGELLGYAGSTGFDSISGRVLTPHCHVEYVPYNDYSYNKDDSANILNPNYLPRVNVSNNVSVIRTTENDPNGLNSHKLAITVTRQNEDFDLNSITLTGNTTSRTVNFNTRAGLNSNNDVPVVNGVYIVPSAFDHNSASYSVAFYFNTATVGSSFVSYSILDAAGTTLASG